MHLDHFMNWRRTLLLALALWCLGSSTICPAAGRAAPWQGRVTQVTDGDTLWVRPDGGGSPRAIRLDGIDAPERCQAYGPVARDQLARRVEGRQVQVLPRRHDDYGRLLARVEHQGQDLGRWMVRQGHAWSYRYRAQPGPYAALEAQARSQHLGLWQGRPERPRTFRQRHGSCH